MSAVMQQNDFGNDERFMVYNFREVAAILRDLSEAREMVNAIYSHGKSLLTTVLEVDVERDAVYLDIGPDDSANQSLLTSTRAIFVAQHQGIRIQWSSSRVGHVKYDGEPAFKIAIPEALQRVQRREYYRLATPILNPLICRIRLVASAANVLRLPVANISAGGLAVNLSDELVVEKGTEFHECKMDLPGIGEIEFDVRVRGVWTVELKTGLSKRVGMEFIRQRSGTPIMIQRYMMQLERDRLAAEGQ